MTETTSRIMQFQENDVILHEGEKNEWIYKILSGNAALYLRYGAEDEYLVGVLNAGRCFGELGILTGGTELYSAIAVSDVTVMRIGREEFDDFLINNHGNSVTIMKDMAKLIQAMRMDLSHLSEELNLCMDVISSMEQEKEDRALTTRVADLKRKLAAYSAPGSSEIPYWLDTDHHH